ncbi:hypothetical protein SDC9_68674 [bioreactor metagenome]|uniref:DUF1275 domain-containing protein n=1 Tax=bioreactor metagenome TaxID=1076179 RepID=A0A644Y6N1_9ZZZZ
MKKEELQRSESFPVAALLALSGGLLDAYTYLSRGGVFANAETGNIVLLGIRLARREWSAALSYLAPILAFALGVLAAELVKSRRLHKSGRYHWRHFTLGTEIAVLTGASFIPRGELDGLVNMMVAFVCAMQVEAFRKVRGHAFATTMCTGNLRSGTEALYSGALHRNRTLIEKGACYYGVIGCFIAGAAFGAVLSGLFPQRAVLGAAVFQSVAFAAMITGEKRR